MPQGPSVGQQEGVPVRNYLTKDQAPPPPPLPVWPLKSIS